MKALYLEHVTSNELPVLQDLPVPDVGPGEVLVRVRAASLNFREIFATRENPAFKANRPFIMGADAAGEVAVLGPGVTGWQVGDRVVVNASLYCGECKYCQAGRHNYCVKFNAPGYYGDPTNGTFAQYFKVAARNLSPIPAHLSFEEAGALPTAYGTAWNALVTQGAVQPGDTVLIHGIGGGVALFALQIAVRVGARVLVTSGSDEKLGRALAMGAAAGINYKTEAVEQRVLALTGGEGVDIVIDGVSGPTLITSLKVAKEAGGRVVRFGAVTGGVDVPSRYLNKTLLMGSMASQTDWDAAIRFANNTGLKPVIHAVYPLEQYREAFAALSDQTQFGKIVFRID